LLKSAISCAARAAACTCRARRRGRPTGSSTAARSTRASAPGRADGGLGARAAALPGDRAAAGGAHPAVVLDLAALLQPVPHGAGGDLPRHHADLRRRVGPRDAQPGTVPLL